MKNELILHEDERGGLIEVFKFPNDGQIYFSTSHPNITRGNHYHNRKIEYFCVVKGEAVIRLRNRETNELIEFNVSGNNPKSIRIPVGHTHNISNTGKDEMFLLVWISEIFNPDDTDTFYEEV